MKNALKTVTQPAIYITRMTCCCYILASVTSDKFIRSALTQGDIGAGHSFASLPYCRHTGMPGSLCKRGQCVQGTPSAVCASRPTPRSITSASAPAAVKSSSHRYFTILLLIALTPCTSSLQHVPELTSAHIAHCHYADACPAAISDFKPPCN